MALQGGSAQRAHTTADSTSTCTWIWAAGKRGENTELNRTEKMAQRTAERQQSAAVGGTRSAHTPPQRSGAWACFDAGLHSYAFVTCKCNVRKTRFPGAEADFPRRTRFAGMLGTLTHVLRHVSRGKSAVLHLLSRHT